MRRFLVGGLSCGPRCPVTEPGRDAPDVAITDLVDFYRERHQFCASKRSWIPRETPEKSSCCPAGNPTACDRLRCGLEAIVGNIPTLLETLAKQKVAEDKPRPATDDPGIFPVSHWQHVVPAPMVKKYVGEALALLTATGDHTGAWEDPADVRLARAVRVLTEFITLVDPPKEQSCGTG